MIFLTGATGYLGSYLLLELLENGYAVRALKRPDSSMAQVHRVFEAYSIDPSGLLSSVEWVDGDILDVFSLADHLKGIDTVVHCAGKVSFESREKRSLAGINVEGTANMINASLEEGVSKFLYVSSIAAMGFGSDDRIISEKTVWKNSSRNSHYAVSKYNGEKEVWRGKEEGLKVLVINPSIILGYGDISHGTFRFFDTLNKGLRFYPCGMNGFVFVRDVTKAVTLLLNHDIIDEKYILSAENLSYYDFFAKIADILGKKPPSVKIGRIIASLAWMAEWARSFITGSKPLLTKETAQTAIKTYQFDGHKIEGVQGFKYTPMDEFLAEIAGKFREKGLLK
ncbi:MAG: NAD-dependent epimerase/dehydratase family protein [Bacteroidales bacterium]